MELITFGILTFVAIITGSYLGYKDHVIKSLKGEIKTLKQEKEILYKLIKDANKFGVPPRELSEYNLLEEKK